MKQKHLLCVMVVLLAGLMAASFATYSRVESMGKTDNFFMDDISIFSNPANINLYANFLTGELGQLSDQRTSDYGDPQKQWFGGVGSYKIGDGSKITAGLVFNREDALVSQIKQYNSKSYKAVFTDPLVIGQFFYHRTPGTAVVGGTTINVADSIWVGARSDTIRLSGTLVDTASGRADTVIECLPNITADTVTWDTTTKNIPAPVGNVEFFLGYSNGKNLNVGGHFYMASQDSGEKDNDKKTASSHVYRGDLGVTYGIGNHSIELAIGFADVSFSLIPTKDATKYPEWGALFANSESQTCLFVGTRIFYDMPPVGAKLVPLFRYSRTKVNVYAENTMAFGIGINKEIEKGLFNAGFEGNLMNAMDSTVYFDRDAALVYGYDSLRNSEKWVTATHENRIKFNFGIERNIAWKWFTVRVGGQKTLIQREITRTDLDGKTLAGHEQKPLDVPVGTERYWVTNADDDGAIDDVIGFGIGFNFGNKLKVDGTINEKFPYQNPFRSGARIATRVSATYSF